MQLEDDIAKELAGIIKEHTGGFVDRIIAIEKAIEERTFPVPEYETNAPDDVVDEIAKAIAMVAEAPPLTHPKEHQQYVAGAVILKQGKTIKTITTRRDEAGNLVARVIED